MWPYLSVLAAYTVSAGAPLESLLAAPARGRPALRRTECFFVVVGKNIRQRHVTPQEDR